MSSREYLHNFFFKRDAFFSGWRGLLIVFIFLAATKTHTENILKDETSVLNVVLSYGILSLLTFLFYRIWTGKKKHAEFLALIWEKRSVLLSGGAVNYRFTQITKASKMVSFMAAFSFVAFTISLPSNFLIPSVDSLARWGIFYSLFSLLFGWWGIPWGPIRTVQALAISLKGGKRQTVEDLLRDLEMEQKE